MKKKSDLLIHYYNKDFLLFYLLLQFQHLHISPYLVSLWTSMFISPRSERKNDPLNANNMTRNTTVNCGKSWFNTRNKI